MSSELQSLRELGNRLDPRSRPKWLVGAGTPFDEQRRPATADAEALPEDLASHPPESTQYLREDCIDIANETAYDLGMINRFSTADGARNPKAKGLVQSHRYVDPDDDPYRTKRFGGSDGPSAVESAGRAYSMRQLLDRHQRATSHKCLWYNTRLNLKKTPTAGHFRENKRAEALGEVLGEAGYDIVGLSEVSGEGRSNRIEENFKRGDSRNRPIKEASGPSGGGLVSIVAGGDRERLDDVTDYNYSTGGLSRKGWQRVDIELSVPGVENAGVELFITHLRAGDKADRRDDRHQQLFRLLLQVRGRQMDGVRPEWPKIVMGDINIHSREENEYDGTTVNDYDHLLERMAEEDMQDAWLTHGGPSSGTRDEPYHEFQPNPAGSGPCHCRDFDQSTYDGDRLDYVFIEKPKPEHTITIDVPRMWRVPFTDECDWTDDRIDDGYFEYGRGGHLFSDHLGIGFELLASPADE